MSNVIEYNGYQAIIEYSAEDAVLFGKVMDIDDKIIFEINDPSETKVIFKEVIDDYLEICKENSKEPCKTYKGVFNVRISPTLHKKAVQAARRLNITLNSFVESVIRDFFDKKPRQIVNIYLNSRTANDNYSQKFSNISKYKLSEKKNNIFSYSNPLS